MAPSSTSSGQQPDQPRFRQYLRDPAVASTLYLLFSGLVGILVFSIAKGGQGDWLLYLGISTAISLAALLVGGLVGFLFGIPKTVERMNPGDGPEETDGPDRQFTPNTNLEQISDWLTKILVGVGLTQISKLPELLQYLSRRLGSAFDGSPASEVFSMSMAIYFVIGGFLLGFIITRLYLPRALAWAETLSMMKRELKAEVVDAVSKQDDQDARAISMVNVQLDPDRNESLLTSSFVTEMTEVIQRCSNRARADIFEKAKSVRSSSWATNKELMARTIPVFEALIAADPEQKFHAPRGQVGYAYKDLPNPTLPDLQRARTHLDTAIAIRGESRQFLFYEFNRAICLILLDADFREGRPSAPPVQEAVLADLAKVKNSFYHSKLAENPERYQDTPLNRWLQLNSQPAFLAIGQ